MIDRHAFANELLLREHIRNAIKVVLERKKQKNMELLEEEEKPKQNRVKKISDH